VNCGERGRKTGDFRRDMTAVWGAKSFGKSEIVRGLDSGCPQSRGQLRVRLESRLRDGQGGPRVSVARGRFFVAASFFHQNKFAPWMVARSDWSMDTNLLADWTKPKIDAACSAEYGRYVAELATHYTRYFEAHPQLRGSHSYSAKDLETALPSGWEELSNLLPREKRHRHFRSGKSSQVLALGLLGVASKRDPSLAWLAQALGTEIGTLTSPPVFEYAVERTLLRESPRVTSIDFSVQTSDVVVCAEIKWSERGLGSCSCSRDEDETSVSTPGIEEEDDGEPAIAECSERVLKREGYWQAAREIFDLPDRVPGSYCPISTAYQAIRNVAAARALAGGRRAVFALIFDERNPYFSTCGDWPGWPAVLAATLPDRTNFHFRAIAWQQLVKKLPLDENAGTWAREKHRLLE
jgi:hypothetical protein